ncbi:hypothetical protein TKK_0001113 [Trichogramma kaykai]|uniref:MPN domain-containing protein n=1 Tax=Trichogramma kaykai TaxID=54128 RepID=A0ABD2WSW9_9HYME
MDIKKQYPAMSEVQLMPPDNRLKQCFEEATNFRFEISRSIHRYCRSGKEIKHQADVYMKEGDIEKAYILYIRCITIYLEKFETHPEYNTLSLEQKEYIKVTLREILPIVEGLKPKLLEKFRLENERKKQELKQLELQRVEKLKQEEKRRKKEEEDKKLLAMTIKTPPIPAKSFADLDDIKFKRQTPAPSAPEYIPTFNDSKAQTSKDIIKVPSVDRSTKPASLTSGDRLRDIIVPEKLMQNFLRLAQSNTSQNIETCGILAGKLERNRLVITHFLIPKQTGSPDSCTTHNEEDIFDFQDQHNLITVGWIHTHPTQTAFLSSVDLHTHCAYQLMMAEAIAIVCAPKYNDTGFFHLTPEHGLNFIANCRENGFHPHPSDPPLFTVAKHFKIDPYGSIESVDLRKK